MRTATTALCLVSAGALCGCARMTPGLGFDGVSKEVQARTGAVTRWDRGSAEDADAHRAVADLLARELTADSAAQVALLNNKDLQATYEDLDIAQADLVRAGLLHNPIFSGEVRFDTSGGGTGIVLDVTQDFLSLFTLPLRKARAGAAFEAAKARVTSAAVNHAFETRAAFFDYQAAEQTRAMRATVLDAASASYELAKRVRAAGNIRELDLLHEQTLLESARLDAQTAGMETAPARERLNALMGTWGPDTAWHAADRLPDLPAQDADPEDLERRAVAASLELAAARADLEQAAAGARLARPLAWLEGSDVGVAAERETDGAWSVGPSIAIPIPVFDLGGAATGEARARLRQAAGRYYARAVNVRAAARSVAATLHTARQNALQYQTVILPLHTKIVEQTQLQYNAMQVSGFQLLQERQAQVAAGAESIAALRAYWAARAGVSAALAGIEPAGFQSTNTGDPTLARNRARLGGGH